jgi:ribosomal protein L29
LADAPCAAPKHTYIHRNLPSEQFASEVEQLKRELTRLQQELRAADANGQRAAAIEILAQMLKLQSAFFERWKSPSVPPPP